MFFIERLSKMFSEVYSPDSYDVASGKFNCKTLEEINDSQEVLIPYVVLEQQIEDYRLNLNVQISTFFGLPNQCELGDEKYLTWKVIFKKNLVGIQKNKSPLINTINFITAFIYTPWKNVAYAVLKTAQNTVKLLTEFLPLVIANECYDLAKQAYEFGKEGIERNADHDDEESIAHGQNLGPNRFKQFLYGIVIALAAIPLIIAGVAKLTQLVGRAITSPINSVKTGWYIHQHEWLRHQPDWLRYFLGFALAVLSIAITSTAYTLLLPLLLAIAPAPILTQINSLLAPILPHIGSILSYVGTHISLLSNTGFVLNPMMAGFTTLFGVGLTTIGTGINELFDWCREKWRTIDPAPKAYLVSDQNFIVEHDDDIADQQRHIASTLRSKETRNINLGTVEITDEDRRNARSFMSSQAESGIHSFTANIGLNSNSSNDAENVESHYQAPSSTTSVI